MYTNLKNSLLHLATGEKSLITGGLMFYRLFYLWLLIIGLLCWPILGITFGEESYTFRVPKAPSLRYNLVYLLTYQAHLYQVVYYGFMISAFLAFMNIGGIISRGIVWVLLIILARSSYMVFNGGMMLAPNYAFFLIFFFPKLNRDWKIVFSNFSTIALKIQFLIVYIFAATYKLLEADWINGDSVHFLSMLDHFTPDWLFEVLQSMPVVMSIMNYTILVFLVLFPVLIWFRKLKPVLFIIGGGFHLYTILFMNLFDFGSIMIMSYLLFIPKDWVLWLSAKFKNVPQKFFLPKKTSV